MIRYAFNTTAAHMRLLHLTATRDFTTGRNLGSKARVGQIPEQAHPAGTKMYKTVKEKACNDKAARRNQLIWLVKHSLGNEVKDAKVSPHELPWSAGAVAEERKEGASVGVSVWPHLWLVFAVLLCKSDE
jgi:hypothetical protein